jgi:hypothetical protein
VRLSGTSVTPSHTKHFSIVATACGIGKDNNGAYTKFDEVKAHFLGYRNSSRRALPTPVIGNMINSFIYKLKTRELSEVTYADIEHVMTLCYLGAQRMNTKQIKTRHTATC